MIWVNRTGLALRRLLLWPAFESTQLSGGWGLQEPRRLLCMHDGTEPELLRFGCSMLMGQERERIVGAEWLGLLCSEDRGIQCEC